jgi:hypothetical protein
MKVLFENYNFNASLKQITFDTTDVISLQQLLLITNVTTNTIIYNFADPSSGGTISNNVLTLTFDTTSMSNSDKLQIFLDNTFTPASEESVQYLKKIIQILTPISVQDANQRQRVTIDAAPASLSVGNVSNIIAFGGVDVRFQFTDAARLTYAQGIRNNLQFN